MRLQELEGRGRREAGRREAVVRNRPGGILGDVKEREEEEGEEGYCDDALNGRRRAM